VDTTKIRQAGWKPVIRLEDGLKQTLEWYAANRAEWQGHTI